MRMEAGILVGRLLKSRQGIMVAWIKRVAVDMETAGQV